MPIILPLMSTLMSPLVTTFITGLILMSGHLVITQRFIKTVFHLPHVKEPVMKGHFLCDIEVSLEH